MNLSSPATQSLDQSTQGRNPAQEPSPDHPLLTQAALQNQHPPFVDLSDRLRSLAQAEHPLAHGSILGLSFHSSAPDFGTPALSLVPHHTHDESLHLGAKVTVILFLVHSVVVLAVQSKVPSHNAPSLAGPTNQGSLAVQMTTHALVTSTPDPSSSAVIIIPVVQVPV